MLNQMQGAVCPAMILMVGLAVNIPALSGCDRSDRQESSPAVAEVVAGSGNFATVAIDFGTERAPIAVRSSMAPGESVLEMMSRVFRDEAVKWVVVGNGSFSLVQSIEGVENQGARGKNWVFRVNGEMSKYGCGVVKLKAGDRVEWSFEEYSPE